VNVELAVRRALLAFCAGVMIPMVATAQQRPAPSSNIFGAVGLIDMPTGEHQKAGQLTTSVAGYSGTNRTTLTFQITKRISGSFRYSAIKGYNAVGRDTRFDRSFDVRFRLLDESKFLPAVTIGLQDFAGTGVYSGEYLVATKNLFPTLKVTAGLGWGRLGGRSGFNQRKIKIGNGGVPTTGSWFRGDIKPFGGLEWQTPITGLRFKAEYSSDAYVVETRQRIFKRNSPYNFGLEYDYNKSVKLGAYYLYGSRLALMVSLSFNGNDSPAPSGLEPAPLPVLLRKPVLKPGQSYTTAWTADPTVQKTLTTQLQALLVANQLFLEALKVTGSEATLYLRNTQYMAQAEAVGRAARVMSRGLPASIETFKIVPVVEGVPISAVTFKRSDLEALEYDAYGSEILLERATIADAAARRPVGLEYAEGVYPKFNWSITPPVRSSFFDPDAPIRMELGIRARARYNLAPGLWVTGSIIKPVVGNLDSIKRGGGGRAKVPRVRSNAVQYFKQGDPAIERLSAVYLFKLRDDVYGRVSVGYLETMYGGVSAEVLWKPANNKLALGAEVNYVKQRDFDQRLGFRNYDVLTGHVSAYYDMDNGFIAQLDAGRYLAGDLGATFTLNRQFNNGMKVGAFFTLTDIPFKDFGEGSFDKGISLSIPMSWGLGKPSRNQIKTVIRPLTRDGGARLNVENRLYGIVSEADGRSVSKTFRRVWR
jgi:hypothetical protein